MTTIRTERLTLRPVVFADLDAIATMMADPEVCRFLGDGTPRTRERTELTVRFAEWLWDTHGYGPFVIERAGGRSESGSEINPGTNASRFVGVCLLIPIVRSGTNPADMKQRGPERELGYWLARSAWGRGYATEAARAVLAWAMSGDGPGMDRVIAVTDPRNRASQRVLGKIGMDRVGETEAFYNQTTTLFETVTAR